jgi:hypothetical protein
MTGWNDEENLKKMKFDGGGQDEPRFLINVQFPMYNV